MQSQRLAKSNLKNKGIKNHTCGFATNSVPTEVEMEQITLKHKGQTHLTPATILVPFLAPWHSWAHKKTPMLSGLSVGDTGVEPVTSAV